MSNKTTTQTNNAYNGASMGNYNSFAGTLGTQLQSMAANPLGSSFFNQQLGMANSQASQVGQRNISNVTNNALTGGGILGNSGAFMQGQINNAARQNTVNQSNAFNTTLMNAMNTQKWALGAMESYNPLQTGATTTQTQQQGLGSILGSVAGIGLNMAMPGLGSMLGGGSFSGGYAANSGLGGL